MNEFLDQLNINAQWALFIGLALGTLKSLLKAAPLIEPAFANSEWAQRLLKQIEVGVTFAGWITLIVLFSAVVEPGDILWLLCVGFLVIMLVVYRVVKRLAKKHQDTVPTSQTASVPN